MKVFDSIEHIDVYIKLRDFDGIGKYFFKQSMANIMSKQFKLAYENIKLGYEFIVCDCILGNWYDKMAVYIINETKEYDCNEFEFDTIKAFVISYSENKEYAHQVLLDYYRKYPDEELSNYLLGKVAQNIDCLKKANEIRKTNKTLYRIGRIIEDIGYVYEASISGYYSICCLSVLAAFAYQRNIKLKTSRDDYLGRKFNIIAKNRKLSFSHARATFTIVLEDFETNFVIPNMYLDSLMKLIKFHNTLLMNNNVFLQYERNMFELDKLGFAEMDKDERCLKEWNAIENMSNSDQDYIRDAFEGDASNYWNID